MRNILSVIFVLSAIMCGTAGAVNILFEIQRGGFQSDHFLPLTIYSLLGIAALHQKKE